MELIGNYHIINSVNYGKVLVNINDSCRFGNCYFVTGNKLTKKLSGIVDKNGNEIIPLDEMELKESFVDLEKENSCFGFKYKDSEILEYYHVKSYDEKAKLVLKTGRNDDIPIKISLVMANPNYWVFETITNSPQYAVYDYKRSKIVTQFFDELIFLKDDDLINNHAIYYSMDICNLFENSNGEVEPYVYTNLCGFLDKECNFSSQILETENAMLYDSYMYGPNTLSKRFVMLIDNLKKDGVIEYRRKELELEEIRSYLYSNYDMSNIPSKPHEKEETKILEFSTRGSRNEKK